MSGKTKRKQILGISRSPKFSPNSADRDAAIFAAVSDRLLRRGYDVSVVSEDLFFTEDFADFAAVYSMARDTETLQTLARAEKEAGVPIVNSPAALLPLTRSSLASRLDGAGVPLPAHVLLRAGDADKFSLPQDLPYPFWLKRDEGCSQQAGDVCLVRTDSEAQSALDGFARRGVKSVLAEQHAEGDLVKFYGVEGSDFFSVTYPGDEGGFSKFGLESHNGAARHYDFSLDTLRETAARAARAAGLSVYGGDAVVAEDGTFRLIDLNDWPSFSSCRKAAARAIAERICRAAERENAQTL